MIPMKALPGGSAVLLPARNRRDAPGVLKTLKDRRIVSKIG